MPKIQLPVSRLICFGSARALTLAGPGVSAIEFLPDDLYDE